MSEDLVGNLQNYKLQLQQVEAALLSSPEDEELLKLKQDLIEVIDLTTELIKSQLPEEIKSDEIEKELLNGDVQLVASHIAKKNWEIGDRCLALWVDDGQYYEATIESIEGEGISVMFDNYSSPVVTSVEFLKELPHAGDKGAAKTKKLPASKLREYQKKKKLKKQMRFKQLEQEREVEKNKWLAFSSKTNKKGISKKSIFASPENVNGRVGIGTCGVGGKGMTDYQQAEKYKK